MRMDIKERLRIMDGEEDSSFLRLDAIDELDRLRGELREARRIIKALWEHGAYDDWIEAREFLAATDRRG